MRSTRIDWRGTLRASVLVVAVVQMATGCASVAPTSNQGRKPTPASSVAFKNTRPGAPKGDSPRALTVAQPVLASFAEATRLSRRQAFRENSADSMTPTVGGTVTHGPSRVDEWEALLLRAGIAERDVRPVAGGPLSPPQAARLLKVLLGKPVTLGQFPSRLAVGHLLHKALKEGEMSRAALLRQAERISGVAVLRPDGCLAWVRSGKAQQLVAPVEWREGRTASSWSAATTDARVSIGCWMASCGKRIGTRWRRSTMTQTTSGSRWTELKRRP